MTFRKFLYIMVTICSIIVKESMKLTNFVYNLDNLNCLMGNNVLLLSSRYLEYVHPKLTHGPEICFYQKIRNFYPIFLRLGQNYQLMRWSF